MKFQKIFLILNSTLDVLFNDTLTSLYDEYIDRPKLSEQKNPIQVYCSSPHKWG